MILSSAGLFAQGEPVIASLSQAVAPLYGEPFTLTVNGHDFNTSSQIVVGNTALTTSFIDATQVSGVVATSMLTTTGTVQVKVSNAGVISNAADLMVVERGDINGSRSVNIGDALVVARTVGGIVKPPLPISVGDLNLNGSANIGDALILALFSGGIATNLPTPAVTSVSPDPVSAGGSLIITGTGFSTTASNHEILFTTGSTVTRVAPSSSTSTTLTVTVPANATSGPIQVYRRDAMVGGAEYTLAVAGTTTPLVLTSVTPYYAVPPAATLTLSGMGFDAIASNNIVKFRSTAGTVNATVTAATSKSLTVTVPAGAVCGEVTVEVGSQKSNARTIVISGTACTPRIIDILGGAAPGEILVLEGAGWSVATPGGNIVTFASSGGTVTAPVLQAGRTQLHVRVPDNAVDGNVVVTTGGQTSNPMVFHAVGGSDSGQILVPPSITSISSASAAVGTTLSATVSGTNLTRLTAVTFSGSGVTATIAYGATSTSLPLTITVDAAAAAGSRSLTVSSALGTSNSIPFTVFDNSGIFFVDSSSAVTKELVVHEGSTIQAHIQVLNSSGVPRTNVMLGYTSSNPEVATVDASGNIQGQKAGFSTLSATGSGLVATATITVVQVSSGTTALDVAGIAQDAANRIYLAATQDHTVRSMASVSETPQIYAGISQTFGLRDDLRLQALFKNPGFIAVDSSDGTLYISDSANNVVRRVQPGSNGRVETVAGTGVAGSQDGPLASATFRNPQGIALDASRNLWVVDSGNNTIRKIDLVGGAVTTVAGLAGTAGSADGASTQARFNSPSGIAIEPDTAATRLDLFRSGSAPAVSRLIVADTGNGLIRRVRVTGEVETLASPGSASALTTESKGPARIAAGGSPLRFDAPTGVAVDRLGNIYITETNKGLLKAILRLGGVVNVVQSNTIGNPKGIAVTQFGKVIVTNSTKTVSEINYGTPVIVSVTPSTPVSGAQATIKGKNFAPESTVIVSSVLVTDLVVQDTETIVLTVPPLPSGTVPRFTVLNRGGLQGLLTSDLTLTSADTPHTMTGNLTVSKGVTLTLDPGVMVRVERGKRLIVDGALVARGSSASPIRFTSINSNPAAGDWIGIHFTDNSTDAQFDSNGNYAFGSVLQNVIVEYGAASSPQGVLWLSEAGPWIDQVTVRQSLGTAIYVDSRTTSVRISNSTIASNGAGIRIINTNLSATAQTILLRGNTVRDNAGNGVQLDAAGYGVGAVDRNNISNNQGIGLQVSRTQNVTGNRTLTITNNTIVGNQQGVFYNWGDATVTGNRVQSNSPAGGIQMTGFWDPAALIVSENILTDNVRLGVGGNGSGGGLYISTQGPVTLTKNIISNNTAGEQGGGVAVSAGSGGTQAIQGNLISGNVAPTSSAMDVSRSIPGSFAVSLNTIVQNRSTRSDGTVANIFYGGSVTFTQNNLFNNTSTYSLSNAYSTALSAQSNWWGTTNDTEIKARIYDFSDNSSRGVVTYTPVLTAPSVAAAISPPSQVQAVQNGNGISMTWVANPESDVAGYRVYFGTSSSLPFTGSVDAGNVTAFTLSGLAPGTYYVAVTAYDANRDNVNDQTDGNESWYSPVSSVIVPVVQVDLKMEKLDRKVVN